MDDIWSVIKAKNAPKAIEILENTETDVTICDDHGAGLTHLCCRYGLIEVIKWLMDKRISFDTRTDCGDTPLHIVAQFHQNDIFDLIVNLPITYDPKNNHGSTPLHYACFWSNEHIATKLVSLGCDISIRNEKNQSPVDLATLDLAEKLTKEFKTRPKEMSKLHQAGALKRCPKASSLARFKLEPYVKFKDFTIVRSLYPNVVDEKLLANFNNKSVLIRRIAFPKKKKVLKSVLTQEFNNLNIWNERTILSAAGFLYTDLEVMIVRPYYELGTFCNFIREKKKSLTEEVKLSLAIDICQGMQYIHKNPYLLTHYMLTGMNIVIDDNIEAKLMLSESTYSFQSRIKIVDAMYYSREALSQPFGMYDKINSDIWSYGIILDEIYTSSSMIPKINNMHIGYKIEKLVNLCLNPVPTSRPQFSSIGPILIKMMNALVDNQ
ncbi:Integrin-linked protein kinase [Thelohanellus kitauei]|uniref:Integrin-linked protein kinase n=1 Tax=Thelohanellus kitauei TaxID=669202 RepID=A0A0C2J107_THEKT|nr:Integrin-linked protein kinase [Thelohanellus kitauei]